MMNPKQITCFFLSAALIFSPSAWPAGINLISVLQNKPGLSCSPTKVPQQAPSYADHRSTLDRAESFITGLQEQLNRPVFDFEALLDSLDYDAEKVIEFSRESIAFEQYSGVLRGPKGTLLSRSGNSIDQALLLAKLLRDAGYDARIAGAQLTAQQGALVLQAMKQPVKKPPAIGNAAGLLGVLEEHDIVSEVDPELIAAYEAYLAEPKSARVLPVYESVIDTSRDVLKQLKDAGIDIGSQSKNPHLVAEARDYYWVQYKDGAADSWLDVHPVFSEASPPTDLKAQRYISGEVPTELLHKIKIRAYIERKVGDSLEVLPITGTWEAPVANLYGSTITFSIFTDSMLGSGAPTENLESFLKSANFFVPAFGNSIAPEARFFDLRGTLIDPFAASSPAAGVFGEINRSFSSAISELGGESSVPTLTAQWLELILIGPNGKQRKFKRTNFDRIGEAARKNNAVPANLSPTSLEDVRTLMQEHTIMVDAGGISMGYIVQSAAKNFQNLRPGVEAILAKVYEKPAKQGSLSDVPTGWKNYLPLLSLFGLAGTLGSNHRIYRSGPAVAIHSLGLGRKGHLLERVDIVSNPRRAVDISGQIPVLDPELMVQSGVWETAIEGILLPGEDRHNTMSTFDEAKKNEVETVVLAPGQASGSIEVSKDVLAAIDLDLSQGYAVIAPKESFHPSRFGWWRVNIETGETLGLIEDGRGATATEYILFTISLAGLIYGSIKCLEKEGGAELGGDMKNISFAEICCIGVNGLWTWASFALGLWITRVPAQYATNFVKAVHGAVGVSFSLSMDAAGIYFPVDAVCD